MIDRERSNKILTGVFLSSRTYGVLILLLFAGAALFRFRFPLQPLIDGDIGGYLEPALLQLTHGQFQHVEGRGFVYPGFILLVLRIFQDFRAITVVQHLLGLAAGGILLACWNLARTLMRKPSIPSEFYRLGGVFTATLFLFNTSAIRFEQLVRPEAIFPFFAILNMLFNIQFIRHRYLDINPRASFIYGSANLFNAWLLFFLKPSFYLGVVSSTLPIWISLLDRKEPFHRKVALIATSACCVGIFLFLPEKVLKDRDDLNRTFLPTTLFVIHANIILKQISDDLAEGADTPYSKQFLEQTATLLKREIEDSKSTGHYRSLGFDPDYLMYRDSFDLKFRALPGSEGGMKDRIKFYYYYFWRAWTQQPGQMLTKVAKQLSILYNNIGKASPYKREVELVTGRNYLNNYLILTSKKTLSDFRYKPLDIFVLNSRELAKAEPRLPQPRALSWVNGALARTFSISIVLMCLLLVGILRNPELRDRYLYFALTIMLFYGYSFANSLGISIIHSLEISRYLTNQLIYTLAPQCMTIIFVGELLARKSQRHRETVH